MAIALDLATDGGSITSTSLTYSHTTGSGSNRVLIVGVRINDPGVGGDKVTGVTYNSVAMSKKVDLGSATVGWHEYIYYLANPDTGAHDVVITRSDSGFIESDCASYTDADQSGVDNFSSAKNDTNVSSLSLPLTTNVDNCWLIAHASNDSDVFQAGANTTLRTTGAQVLCDSNGPKSPAGAYSLALTIGGANMLNIGVIVSLAPASAPPATDTILRRKFLGVGL